MSAKVVIMLRAEADLRAFLEFAPGTPVKDLGVMIGSDRHRYSVDQSTWRAYTASVSQRPETRIGKIPRIPCPVDGCSVTAGTPGVIAAHRKAAHDA